MEQKIIIKLNELISGQKEILALLSRPKSKSKATTLRPAKKCSDWDARMAETFSQYLESVGLPQKNKRHVSQWANVFRLMREQDGLETELIERVCNWVVKDAFWSKVIHSPRSLRKHWPKIYLQFSKAGISAGQVAHKSLEEILGVE